MALDKRLKKKWVAALRSGKFKQGHEMLYRPPEEGADEDGKFCCLGVLGSVIGVKLSKMEYRDFLSKVVQPCPLSGEDENFLGSVNDQRSSFHVNPRTGKKVKISAPWSFPRIATWIEKNL